MWFTTKKNPKEVTGIMNSTRKGVCPNLMTRKGLGKWTNDHKVNKRYEKPKEGVCLSRRALKGVCLSMMTHKNQEIDQIVMRSIKDLMNSKIRVCPSVRWWPT